MTYQVDIYDADGNPDHISGPHTQYWREGNIQANVQIRGLGLNSHYVANITVSTLVGTAYVSFKFSEFIIAFMHAVLVRHNTV